MLKWLWGEFLVGLLDCTHWHAGEEDMGGLSESRPSASVLLNRSTSTCSTSHRFSLKSPTKEKKKSLHLTERKRRETSYPSVAREGTEKIHVTRPLLNVFFFFFRLSTQSARLSPFCWETNLLSSSQISRKKKAGKRTSVCGFVCQCHRHSLGSDDVPLSQAPAAIRDEGRGGSARERTDLCARRGFSQSSEGDKRGKKQQKNNRKT